MASEAEAREIRETARRRWVELQKQIARHGADSDPADLIEAEDIARRWGFSLDPRTVPVDLRGEVRNIEIEWLRILVASALKTVAAVQAAQSADADQRRTRQRLNTAIYAVILILQLVIVAEVGRLAGRVGGW